MRLEFALKPKQRAFVESDKPWTAFIGGVGSGKSYAGAVRSIIAATREAGSLGCICAPTYAMLRDTTQRMVFQLLPKELISTFNKNEQLLTLRNGSEILFRSVSDPDRVRGLNLTWCWLDEAPFAGYYAWQLLKQRVGRQDPKRFAKRGWITGTPKGQDGYYREFQLDRTPDHLLVQSSSLENASNLPDNYVDGLRFSGAFYQQEIMGEFTAFSGLVYKIINDPDDPASHVITALPPRARWRTVVGGLDWGFTNPSVALVVAFDNDDHGYVTRELYQRRLAVEDFFDQIIALTQEYGVTAWYADPAEPQHIARLIDRLENAHLDVRVVPGDHAIIPGIQTVQAALATRDDGTPGLRISAECVNLIAECNAYQYASTPTGEVDGASEKPLKASDHAVDALRYLLHTPLSKERAGTARLLASGPPRAPNPSPFQRAVLDASDTSADDDSTTQRRRTTLSAFVREVGTLGLDLRATPDS